MRSFIFSDLHGNFKGFAKLLSKIEKKITPEDNLIFLGDYIDRGPNSFEIVDFIITDLQSRYGDKLITLRGNHEQMLLRFMEPTELGDTQLYLQNGGHSTLRSYQDNNFKYPPPKHMEFFKNLKWTFEDENGFYVHAGLSPKHPGDYDPDTILWIRDSFYNSDFHLDKPIVFGHTSFRDKPWVKDGKIGICMFRGKIDFQNWAITCLQLPEKILFFEDEEIQIDEGH